MRLAHALAKKEQKKKPADDKVTEIYHKLQKSMLFQGETKVYKPLEATDGSPAESLPPETKLVQLQVLTLLKEAFKTWTEIFDATYQVDLGNQKAKADVMVDGQALLTDVPVTTLMYLIKRFEHAQTIIKQIPTPSMEVNWEFDNSSGLLRSKEPDIVNRTKKKATVIVKFPPTDKHPGQAEIINDDVVVGRYEKVYFSGAMQSTDKAELLVRVDKLLTALKQARQTANIEVTAEEKIIGDTLFSYLLPAKT